MHKGDAMNDRLSINVVTTWKWDLGQSIDAYARLGVRGIGVIKALLDDYGRQKGIQQIKDAGLRVSSYAGIGRFTNPATTQANVERAIAELDVAAELGAECVYVTTGPRGDLSWEAAAKQFTEGLNQVVPAARERGLRLAIEPIHPMRQDLTFINTAADAADVARGLGEAPVGYVLDFYHLWWNRGILDTISDSIDRIFAVQVSDHKETTMKTMDRAMLGEGIMPMAELLRSLEDAGYQGLYDIEVISEDNERIGYDETLRRVVAGFATLWSEAHA